MPILKRCKTTESASPCEDDGGGDAAQGRRKQRKEGGGFHPLELLGDVAAGRIPFAFSGFYPPRGFGDDEHEDFNSAAAALWWCSEVSFCSGEVESEARVARQAEKGPGRGVGSEMAPPVGEARPAVVRTSRGRVQVLPSRFNDSLLLDPWKKERPKSQPPNAGACVEKEIAMPKTESREAPLMLVHRPRSRSRSRGPNRIITSEKHSVSSTAYSPFPAGRRLQLRRHAVQLRSSLAGGC